MSPFSIPPVQPLGDRFRDDVQSQLGQERSSSSVSKVKGLVHERIGLSASRSALLPSASAPRVLIDLLSAFSISSLQQLDAEGRQPANELMQFSPIVKRPKARKSSSLKKGVPIGLRRRGSFPFFEDGMWVNPFNALMQFMLFLPEVADLFFFAPRSFHPFQDFIDQYRADQHEHQEVSSANTASLVRCALRKLPSHLFRNQADLYEIFRSLIKALFPTLPAILASPVKTYFSDSIAFHPEWHLIWEIKNGKALDELVQQKWEECPLELLVSIKEMEEPSCHLIKKQFFTPSDWFCYDLDAFIELRPDGAAASYITYLKIDGGWYQCDEDRISHLRSNCLHVPLCRSILLHYKRIEFGRPGWG